MSRHRAEAPAVAFPTKDLEPISARSFELEDRGPASVPMSVGPRSRMPASKVLELSPSEDDEVESPSENEGLAPESTVVVRSTQASEEGADNMLSRYFRDMSNHDVMTQEAEAQLANSVEDAESNHWSTLLSYESESVALLNFVAGEAAKLAESTAVRGLAELTALFTKRASGKSVRAKDLANEKIWLREFGEDVRRLDVDREWMYAAARFAKTGRLDGRSSSFDSSEDEQTSRNAVKTETEDDDRPSLRVVDTARLAWIARIDESTRVVRSAKDRFVRANLRLVVSISRRYNRGRMSLIDIIQEGNIGLMKAVERFDYKKGFRFSTYASWWIRHAISRAMADKGRAVRVPVHMLDSHYKVQKITSAMRTLVGRAPTLAELAETTGLPEDKLSKMLPGVTETPLSLDRTVGDDEGLRFIDFLEDESPCDPSERMQNEAWRSEVERLMGQLSPMENRILRLRFGFENETELTLKEIGEQYNLSRERIRQLQEQALGKMRKQLDD